MQATPRNRPGWHVGAAALAMLGLAATGCETAPPGAGFTNGPAPDTAEDKAGTSVVPGADATPDRGEILGEVGDGATDGGTGARGGDPGTPDPAAKGEPSGEVRATPPAIEPPSSGATPTTPQ